jgi:hypothetical protein
VAQQIARNIWKMYKSVTGLISCNPANNKKNCKTHQFQRSCVHDCSLVFRKSDDQSNERKMETAPKEIILKNLDEFSRKWKHISETSSDGPLLRETFDVQVKNLRKHVALGCLSGIPPSFSTSINESLHQKINDLYAGVKMGPELAFALLTVFCMLGILVERM